MAFLGETSENSFNSRIKLLTYTVLEVVLLLRAL